MASTTDVLDHHELMHTYSPGVRVDRDLGQLRAEAGRARGVGVAPVPETLTQRSLPGGRMTNKELFGAIEQALSQRFGAGQWLMATAGSSPYLNYALIKQLQLDQTDVRLAAASAAMAVPHVARVYTRDQLLRGEVAGDVVGRRVLRGFNAQRSGDLEIILEPFWMRQATGTTHGSPYNYDAHIPLILMGHAIKRGAYSEHVALNDLAPTLATLIDVDPPSGSSGRVLTEAIVQHTGSVASPRR